MRAGIYKHYKGGFYLLLGIGAHSETGEFMVVYVSLDATRPGPRLRIRPLDGPEGWSEPVTIGGISRPRFEWVGTSL